ncbi:MAG: carbon monoxide dehydrogenase, partial [Actinomycetota bacterium]|nr:carbon monoxide dehydrogenase [Actinomycetota bacterium]
SGKAAQFGRGVLADVAGHLIGQFANSLESELLGGAAPAAQSAAAETPRATAGAGRDDVIDSVALVKAVAPSVAKRYAPVAAGLAVGVVIGFLVGRRRRHTHPAADDLQALLARLVS